MTFMDALTPSVIQPSVARKVALLEPETLPKKRIYNRVLQRRKVEQKQAQPVEIDTLEDHLKKKRIRNLKAQVKRLQEKLAATQIELEEAIRA